MNLLLSFLIVTAFALQMITIVLAQVIEPILTGSFHLSKHIFKNHVFELVKTEAFARDNDVRFHCINSESTIVEVKLNDSEVEKKLQFNASINFVIHGFMGEIDPVKNMARAWAIRGHVNVCFVDWTPLAGTFPTDYVEVASHNTVITANTIHRFMEFLVDHGMDITDVSMAGHSLGAHISGFVGAKFNRALKAIYGLDPAGPGFQNAPKENKLNSDDAQYVQCIYTDGDTYGTDTDYGDGHGNFFMHDGKDQPGCDWDVKTTCDHSRAIEYFTESLDASHIFEGEECRVKNNQHRKDRIGIHSKKEKSTFCVKVNENPPYAQGEIIPNLAKPEKTFLDNYFGQYTHAIAL